jgi:hypothetical protein
MSADKPKILGQPNMLNKIVRNTLIVFCCAAFFVVGWISSLHFHSGEQAMACLMDSVSAIKYLEKGDNENAKAMMHVSAEGSVLIISKYGTPILDWHFPGAREKWLQRYTDILSGNAAVH